MEIVLSWILVNILTYLSKKLKLSGTVMSVLLSLLVGTMYYVITNYYGATYEQIAIFVWGAYATSQVIYNIIVKIQK
jgi:uncharacterized membrane protein YwaF